MDFGSALKPNVCFVRNTLYFVENHIQGRPRSARTSRLTLSGLALPLSLRERGNLHSCNCVLCEGFLNEK